jgi:hypothetical protein
MLRAVIIGTSCGDQFRGRSRCVMRRLRFPKMRLNPPDFWCLLLRTRNASVQLVPYNPSIARSPAFRVFFLNNRRKTQKFTLDQGLV